MEALKRVWNWFLDLFGIRKNSKYVSGYLNEANMRSGIYMAGVIAVLECWLIIRQHEKYIIPDVNNGTNYFDSLLTNTSLFWLMLFLGLSMFAYCILCNDKKISVKKVAIVITLASIGFVLCCLIPLEKTIQQWKPSKLISNILLIVLYASIALFQVSIIVGSVLRFKKIHSEAFTSIVVVSLFALSCLIFGVRVSYSDFFTSSSIQPKQFICFLMMTIYVGCLLIWKPYISIGILGGVFLGFYFLIKNNVGDQTVYYNGEIIGIIYKDNPSVVVPFDGSNVKQLVLSRTFLDGDEINYLTFFISLAMVCVSIYAQRIAEAKKDQELELLATRDKLTGLYSFEYFLTLAREEIAESKASDEFMYLFVDITSFKVFNDQRGFTAGNKFLCDVGAILTNEFKDAFVSRQSDDHYAVFMKHDVNIQERINAVDEEVRKLDMDIKPGVIVGGYIFKTKEEDPHRSMEKARYACTLLKNNAHTNYLEYDQKMHDSYRQVQYVVRHIDEAIENGYLKPYYQPVVWSKDRELCGAEALCRWIDPKYGFMNPGLFIGALEDAQLVYKLDVAMLRLVCKDMKYNMDNKLPVIPVSINFSRADFTILDVPSVVESICDEYGISHDLIHVEVTESALLEQGDVLKSSMKKLKEKGFALWLDDFGSGYSSFNALKDYDFDVLKLDMQFLVGFDKNEKARALIESVITMANKIGMRTLSEGVETKEQADFLEEVSCGRLQGYLYGKPLPYDELMVKIKSKELVITKEF